MSDAFHTTIHRHDDNAMTVLSEMNFSATAASSSSSSSPLNPSSTYKFTPKEFESQHYQNELDNSTHKKVIEEKESIKPMYILMSCFIYTCFSLAMIIANKAISLSVHTDSRKNIPHLCIILFQHFISVAMCILLRCTNTHTYTHTCTHTYTHPYIYSYIHAYIYRRRQRRQEGLYRVATQVRCDARQVHDVFQLKRRV